MSANACRVKRSFKPYQNQLNSVKVTGEKGKKPCNIDPKIAMKILFHYPPTFPFTYSLDPTSFPTVKPFPPKRSLLNPQQKKKKRQRKRKKKGGEKAKSTSQDCCVTFKPKNYLKILPSAYARTSQTNILHLDQKAAKSTTCKRFCGKF